MDKTAMTLSEMLTERTLSEMVAERDRLNAAIETEQTRLRADWNSRLDDLQRALITMLKLHQVPYTGSERKNVSTVTIDNPEVTVEFPYDDSRWSASNVRILAGQRVRIEVDPLNVTDEEFLGLVGVLIGTL